MESPVFLTYSVLFIVLVFVGFWANPIPDEMILRQGGRACEARPGVAGLLVLSLVLLGWIYNHVSPFFSLAIFSWILLCQVLSLYYAPIHPPWPWYLGGTYILLLQTCYNRNHY